MGTVKLKIPSFSGKSDPEAYIEWERKVDFVFDCNEYSDERKLKLVVVEFTDYAIVWWDKLVTSRRRNGEDPITTWTQLKRTMRNRFVPDYYYRDLHQKLQCLTQGTKTVDEYHKEIEMMLIRADVNEDRETTMARFLAGLNPRIVDRVEMQTYVELDELVSKAIRAERQLKRQAASKATMKPIQSFTPAWKIDDRKDFKSKGEPSKPRAELSLRETPKGTPNTSTPQSRSRDITCFRCLGKGHTSKECPNRRAMFMREGQWESASEDDVEEEGKRDECESDEGDVESLDIVRGKLLVVQRALSAQARCEDEEQRENIFYTRCLVEGKYDRGVMYDGRRNRYTFSLNGKTVALDPLSPKQVREDQIQLAKSQAGNNGVAGGQGEEGSERKVRIGESGTEKEEKKVKEGALSGEREKNINERKKESKRVFSSDDRKNKQKANFFASKREIERALSCEESEFEDVFPEEEPGGLPPLRGIEHHIDFIPGASIPNRPAYRSNPEETREVQKQVEALLERGKIRESMSPCAVPVIVVPKKNGE
ncbi:hypothetical protein AKJ16_DCAP04304 [Drosera capensis]